MRSYIYLHLEAFNFMKALRELEISILSLKYRIIID